MATAQWLAADYSVGGPPGDVTNVWQGDIDNWTIVDDPSALGGAALAFTGSGWRPQMLVLNALRAESDCEIRGRFYCPAVDAGSLTLAGHKIGGADGSEDAVYGEITQAREATIRQLSKGGATTFVKQAFPEQEGWYLFHFQYQQYSSTNQQRRLRIWRDDGSTAPSIDISTTRAVTFSHTGLGFGVNAFQGSACRLNWITFGTDGDPAPGAPGYSERLEIRARIEAESALHASLSTAIAIRAAIACDSDMHALLRHGSGDAIPAPLITVRASGLPFKVKR